MLVSAIHDYDDFVCFDLQELWFFLIKETPELYFFFMIYLQNGVLSTRHAFMGCDTTSEVVTKKKSY